MLKYLTQLAFNFNYKEIQETALVTVDLTFSNLSHTFWNDALTRLNLSMALIFSVSFYWLKSFGYNKRFCQGEVIDFQYESKSNNKFKYFSF